MSLPKLSKKDTRSVSVTVRLTRDAADQLKTMAKSNELSQATIVDHLVKEEYRRWVKRR